MRSMTVFNYLLEATVIGSVIILLVIAVRALLRDRIISACDHYLEKGFWAAAPSMWPGCWWRCACCCRFPCPTR